MTLALVDNRVPVQIIRRNDTLRYNFQTMTWEPARGHAYLVQCTRSLVPCQHIVAADRITLTPTEVPS